ncbi:helix-turn-helix domain-containing protein [Bifidobacterium vansinderenii]|uniref:Uncharacterized protein n=1 Tax=Bifidobacterium vansinderenii TaxID=1984871 RepID=A0A229VWQ4_9BIFI|nr:hypothetical protein [Bifidobacterium vansinderenii]OXN00054.1 hypothetical protein Tam10B_1689 [Bifidobacterium vansinderenii]
MTGSTMPLRMRGKADFRALREKLGVTQPLLAKRMHRDVRTVKAWEDPRFHYGPPREAWDWLQDLEMDMWRSVARTVADAEERRREAREAGRADPVVSLPYFRHQMEYESVGAPLGWFRLANAVSARAGDELNAKGFSVDYEYPSGVEN